MSADALQAIPNRDPMGKLGPVVGSQPWGKYGSSAPAWGLSVASPQLELH